MSELPVLYESADIARLAGITPGLIRRMAANGEITASYVTARGGRLFSAGEVETFLKWYRLKHKAKIQRRTDAFLDRMERERETWTE